jgi:hypothetical protein
VLNWHVVDLHTILPMFVLHVYECFFQPWYFGMSFVIVPKTPIYNAY